MIDRDKVKNLLARGASPTMVSQMLGCTPQAISMMLAEESFAQSVIEARFAQEQRHVDHDERLDALEETIITNLEASIGFCFKPEVLMRALQIVNGAKRRATSELDRQASVAPREVVVLSLPPVMANAIKMNARGEVIQVGQREMVTLDTNSFQRLASEHKTLGERMGATYENGRTDNDGDGAES